MAQLHPPAERKPPAPAAARNRCTLRSAARVRREQNRGRGDFGIRSSETQLKAIAGALKRRLGRDIDLTTRIDTALVGGIVIRAGDLVIDGSVQGKLHALATI